MSRIVNEEVSCNKIIPTFLPAEFIGSKIDKIQTQFTLRKMQKTD